MNNLVKPGQCVGGTVMAEYLYIPRDGPPTSALSRHQCSRCEGGGCNGRPEIAGYSDETADGEDGED